MDGRRPLFLLHDLDGRIGSDAAPIAADLQHSAELNDKLAVPGRDCIEGRPALQREGSMVVYCGSDRQVSEGSHCVARNGSRRKLSAGRDCAGREQPQQRG
jgi:hypothetical protein